MAPITILFVNASPPDTTPLRNDIEQRNVLEALGQGEGKVSFQSHVLPAARIDDLPRHLRLREPQILHIACHGTPEGELAFNAADDQRTERLAAEHLADILRTCRPQDRPDARIRCVVLAGCWTAGLARLLSEQVDCVIGFDGEADDQAIAATFTPQFYAALRDDRSVRNAADTACAILNAHNHDIIAAMLRVHQRAELRDDQLRPSRWQRFELSPSHLEYLRRWFDQKWTTVSLAEYAPDSGSRRGRQEQKSVSLLEIYVPLQVDFAITLKTEGGKIVDWWAKAPNVERNLVEELRITEEVGTDDPNAAAKQMKVQRRAWSALEVGEDALQMIVDDIQDRLDADRSEGKKIEDRLHNLYMEAHDAAVVQPYFVLLGKPGMGKSSFLRHLTLCLAGELRHQVGDNGTPEHASRAALRDWLPRTPYTPLYIELRHLVREAFPSLPADEGQEAANLDVEGFWRYVGHLLGESLKSLALPGGELRKAFEHGTAILLLDGLDEVPDAQDWRRQAQMRALIAKLKERYTGLRMIIASRPQAYDRGDWRLDGFGVARLEPLGLDRLDELARALFPLVLGDERGLEEARRFLETVRTQLEQRHIERSFYANPLFFTLLAGLWLDPNSQGRLPDRPALLYRASIDLLLDRWQRLRRASHPVTAEPEVEGPPQAALLRSVLEILACSVHEQSKPGQDTTQFDEGQLLKLLRRQRELRRVMGDIPEYLTGPLGILTSQVFTAPEEEVYSFTHRSFQEHLAACELTYDRRAADARVPPVAKDRRFPDGLKQRLAANPELWGSVAHLAAGELRAQDRFNELGGLLTWLCGQYVQGQSAPLPLLALEIAREQKLFEQEPTELTIPAADFTVLRDTALALLVDHAGCTPEQRNLAGELLGARREHDTRAGVGLRDGLPAIDWVEVPKVNPDGRQEFIYQEDELRDEPTFWIARYPITYLQFEAFVTAADGIADERWWVDLDAPSNVRGTVEEQAFRFWNHPRERVTWYAAFAFCRWLTHRLKDRPDLLPVAVRDRSDWSISLPTEWQWEKAARGHDGRRYPWGSDEDKSGFANIDETYASGGYAPVGKHYLKKSSAVGMYPHGASPYGISDLSGNVWEWCLNEYQQPQNDQESRQEARVLRGGSWLYYLVNAAAVSRLRLNPHLWSSYFGLRVVCAVPVS